MNAHAKTHAVTLIPGDGIGPEISASMQEIIAAAGVDINWDVQTAGIEVMDEEGTPLPKRVLESIRKNKVCIKGPVTTPIGTGFRSINVALRQEFDLYINLRPVRTLLKDATFQGIDQVIFRENTEDLYAGIEFEMGSDQASTLRQTIKDLKDVEIREDAGISIKPISVFGSTRIIRAAFEYAVEHGRKKVTAIHKANIMKDTDGLFLKVAREIAEEYKDKGIEFNEMIVDAACMNLVIYPQDFDVLVLPNLYGDIVSDLCAGMTGGIGLAPGANISDEVAIFEAVHGSAPDIAGRGIANPTALIRSAVLMLDYLGENDAARTIEESLIEVLQEGKTVTGDIAHQLTPAVKPSSTKEFAAAVIERISAKRANAL